MKTTGKIQKEVDLKILKVVAGVRYWEDATVNGVEDEEGVLIPCRDGNAWCPVIDVDAGVITNWTQGVKADVHYKVCDSGSYYLLDEAGAVVLSIEDGYVPKMMCPKENGFGDYIIMDIDETGKIANWKQTIVGFLEED